MYQILFLDLILGKDGELPENRDAHNNAFSKQNDVSGPK